MKFMKHSCVVALVAADFSYSDSHGTKMWMPSRFAFRAVTSSGLVTYFVVREMRRKKANSNWLGWGP